MTGDPGKKHYIIKPPSTVRIRERSKEEGRYKSVCPI